MLRTVTLLCAPLLTSALAAQGVATLPPGFASVEATGWSDVFGGWSAMRAQVLDKNYIGSSANVKEVAARRDGGRTPSSLTFPGRTWSDVRLTLAETDFARISATFTANLGTNARTVFSGSVTWPGHLYGASTSLPETWAADVRFPLASPWSYSGKNAMVLDFSFTGGTLANTGAWTKNVPYYLDGIDEPLVLGGSSTNVGANTCTVSPFDLAPMCAPALFTYAKQTGSAATSDKFAFQWWLHRFPPSTPTAYAVSLSGSATGVDIGNPCQNVFVGIPISLIALGTTPASNANSHVFPPLPITQGFVAAAVGLQIWTQAGWTHPTRNRFELTRAGYAAIPRQPTPPAGTAWIATADVNSTIGTGPSAARLPVLRLAY